MTINYEQLNAIILYDKDTGVLRWRIKTNPRAPAGQVAGGLDQKGYAHVSILGKQYRAHRVAWMLHYGSWPNGQIDHIDGVKNNNRIENLREATAAENQRNKPKNKNNTSGFKGVSRHKQTGKWAAVICLNGKQQHLGVYATPEAAHEAYCEAAERLHKNFRRTS